MLEAKLFPGFFADTTYNAAYILGGPVKTTNEIGSRKVILQLSRVSLTVLDMEGR